MGIEISMVDASDLSKLKAAIKPKTKVKKFSVVLFQQTIIITCYTLLMNISMIVQKSRNSVCKGYLHNWEFLRIPRNSQKTGNSVCKGTVSSACT